MIFQSINDLNTNTNGKFHIQFGELNTGHRWKFDCKLDDIAERI